MTMNADKLETRIYTRDNEIILNITDHHSWGTSDHSHLAKILKEIKLYLGSFISGDIYDSHPEAKHKERIVEFSGKYPLNDDAKQIFSLLEKKDGLRFRFGQTEE
jgi:hypothetical protein